MLGADAARRIGYGPRSRKWSQFQLEPKCPETALDIISALQLHVTVLTDQDRAAALLDVGSSLSSCCLLPREAPSRLGLSTNLAHHYVKRHAPLGLLRRIKREAD